MIQLPFEIEQLLLRGRGVRAPQLLAVEFVDLGRELQNLGVEAVGLVLVLCVLVFVVASSLSA